MTSTLATDGGCGATIDDNGRAERKLGRELGELEKRRAHARIRRRNFYRNRQTQRIAVAYLLEHGRCTADHIRPLLPPAFLNANGDDRWIGAVFGGLADDGVIAEVGAVRSARREAHGRKLTLWGLPDDGQEIARRWLANHPAPVPVHDPAAGGPEPAEFPPPADDLPHPEVSAVVAAPTAHAPPLPGPLWPASMPLEKNTPAAVSGHGRES